MFLVTGGAGFIGSNIVAALSGRGEDVVICDRLGRDERWRNIAKHDPVDVVYPEHLSDWLASRKLDGVIHMGAISATTESNVDTIFENNIRLSLDLWEWCGEHRVPFIYASSAATYGDGGAGFDDDPGVIPKLVPLNAYGWSKQMVDRSILRRLARGDRSPPQWAGLKFFNVYGPNEYHKGDMQSLPAKNFAAVRDGAAMKLFKSYRQGFKDGQQRRDFIHVPDCVAIVLWLIANPAVTGIYNVGTGQARSWLDLSHALFAALATEPKIEFIEMPASMRGKYQYFTEARVDRLRAAGYNAPFTSLEQGVRDYVTRYLNRDDPYG